MKQVGVRRLHIAVILLLLIALVNLYHHHYDAIAPVATQITHKKQQTHRVSRIFRQEKMTLPPSPVPPPIQNTVECPSFGLAQREAKFYNASICYTRPQILATIRDLVLNVTSLFETHEITYFLESGTLLGAYRNQSVISHDHDADLAIDLTGYEYLRDHLVDVPSFLFLEVYNSSWHPSRDRTPQLPVRFIHKHSAIFLDVFVFLEHDNGQYIGPEVSWSYFNCASCPTVDREGKELKVPYNWIYPLINCTFESKDDAKCPQQTKTYLEYIFGPHFMIPMDYTY